jgi:hypothetical protein
VSLGMPLQLTYEKVQGVDGGQDWNIYQWLAQA